MNPDPMLIAVAPNGARKTKADHPALPLTPMELARAAARCAEAGAGMIHLHARDEKGRHTLEPEYYRPVVREVSAAVGDRMLIQLTSEAAGVYDAPRQMDLVKRLAPHCISCGLREFVRDRSWFERGAAFFSELRGAGTLVQYILYSPEDVRWYETLCNRGVIPGTGHLLLFVLGRPGGENADPDHLPDYLGALKRKSNWMVCAFGKEEHSVMLPAAEKGGHARVGFENNLLLPSGNPAPDNAALVELTAGAARRFGRKTGGKQFAESLYQQE